MVVYNILF